MTKNYIFPIPKFLKRLTVSSESAESLVLTEWPQWSISPFQLQYGQAFEKILLNAVGDTKSPGCLTLLLNLHWDEWGRKETRFGEVSAILSISQAFDTYIQELGWTQGWTQVLFSCVSKYLYISLIIAAMFVLAGLALVRDLRLGENVVFWGLAPISEPQKRLLFQCQPCLTYSLEILFDEMLANRNLKENIMTIKAIFWEEPTGNKHN